MSALKGVAAAQAWIADRAIVAEGRELRWSVYIAVKGAKSTYIARAARPLAKGEAVIISKIAADGLSVWVVAE